MIIKLFVLPGGGDPKTWSRMSFAWFTTFPSLVVRTPNHYMWVIKIFVLLAGGDPKT